ncbi:response regulator [Paenibacillus sp. HW567]|uniref:response regulator n=1 Tax=Paenibacillus sp. HW567 TaxID=1034769 RepID=UPI00037246BE|nr:response regulator [Paenibacillus sp. HW567]
MNVLTMCVMDDIQMVVSGVAYQIPWAEHGIEVIGTAGDGEKGLRMIRELRPDIVLTDICMPKLGGCDMIREIVKEELPTKVIFMSGFNNFEYAQEAVRLGATDYLLKPFTRNQVVQSVLKVRKSIEQEREKADKLLRLEQEVLRSKHHLRDEYLRGLLHQGAGVKTHEHWREHGLSELLPSYQVLVLEAEFRSSSGHAEAEASPNKPGWKEADRTQMESLLTAKAPSILLQESGHRLVALVRSKSDSDGERLLKQCEVSLKSMGLYPFSVGISLVKNEPTGMQAAYLEAQKALEYSFYSTGASVHSYANLDLECPVPRYSPEKERDLLYALRSGSKEQMRERLDEIFLTWVLQSGSPDPAAIIQLFQTLISAVYRTMLGLIKEEQQAELEAKLALMQGQHWQNYSGWMQALADFCEFSCDLMQNRQLKDHSQLISQVKLYIDQHLNTNLTVNSCAKAVHISPSYLANLFKKETSMTLASYIANVRIEKAKEWLMEGIQVQLISAQLGYEDRPYFSEMFKKHCGVTPSTFRQQYFEQMNLKKR